jgi:hypothetical protein
MTARSTGLTGAAAIPTRTSPGPGSTTGTSMISIESGPPGVRTTAVRKVEMLTVSLLVGCVRRSSCITMNG